MSVTIRYAHDTFRYSATDLADFLRCTHLVHLRRQQSRDIAIGVIDDVAVSTSAMQKGIEFEAQTVARLRAAVEERGGTCVDICGATENRDTQRKLLREAITDGVELIVQAPLWAANMGGIADVLERVDHGDGSFTYEPVEVKLARNIRPAFILQLCVYAQALEELLGDIAGATAPTMMHVECGDGNRHSWRSTDYLAYFRAAKKQFTAQMQLPIEEQVAQLPDPVAHCPRCDFAEHCNTRRTQADHLSTVARLRVDQLDKLRKGGIHSLTDLATTTATTVAGIGAHTFANLHDQARLQHHQNSTGEITYELREPDGPGRGFTLLPAPDAGDIFFDFEGYPYHDNGSLEYLWGWHEMTATKTPVFRYEWADTVAQELEAFERFLTYVEDRLQSHPDLHIYHYAPYEVTQLRRLARLHPEHSLRVEELISNGVFVDLYTVVRHTLRVSQPSYSIKYLEPLYGRSRADDEVATAGASIEEYERWLDTNDLSIRQAIIDYNEVDCISTLELRDWLLERQAEAASQGIIWPAGPDKVTLEEDADKELARTQRAGLHADLAAIARDGAPALDSTLDPNALREVRAVAGLLGHVLNNSYREWKMFTAELLAGAGSDSSDHIEDPKNIGGMTLEDVREAGKSTDYIFKYPLQSHTVEVEQVAYDPVCGVKLGMIREINDAHSAAFGSITVRMTPAVKKERARWGAPQPSGALMARKEVSDKDIQDAVQRIATKFVSLLHNGTNPFDITSGPESTVYRYLARQPVAFSSPQAEAAFHAGLAVDSDGVDLTALACVVGALDHSTLILQGPPGTGKTYSIARVITQLVRGGARVGIMSNSHAAILNVLDAVDEHVAQLGDEHGTSLQGGYSTSGFAAAKKVDTPIPDWVETGSSKDLAAAAAAGTLNVLAGTAWQFSRPELVGALDVLFIDEAGQVGLPAFIAAAPSARSIALIGDPQQLGQPSAASHPEDAGLSCLEFMFDGAAVVPSERGILLPVTHRMHPDIANWISDSFYRSKLHAHAKTDQQVITGADTDWLNGSGLRVCTVEHAHCSTESPEEAAAILQIVSSLTNGARWIDDTGTERDITVEDIVIVAPFNRQVSVLRQALPVGARIGTVDKFQGQEAAVAIWSVTSSSRDDAPRGLDFLLSPNRMNVAISRARAVAIVVMNPGLLATAAQNAHEMHLINALCLLAERATTQRA